MSKFIFIGDSITVGTYTAKGDICPAHIAKPNYAEIVSSHYNSTYINYAQNGISFSSTSPVNSEDCICNKIDIMDTGDYLFVAGGTNDFGTNVLIGNKWDNTDISFIGAVEKTFRKISDKYKRENVYVLLPITRYDEMSNEIGLSLQDYRNILISKAVKYAFNIIDTKDLKINSHSDKDRENIILDGVHINEYGHKLLAEYIIEYLEKNNDKKRV